MKRILVCVGHGGKDPGATAHGLKEKDLNLVTSLALKERLNTGYSGHKIVLTRDDDTFVGLNSQIAMAKNMEADYVVDVHYNSFYLEQAHGFETFIHSGHLTASNRRGQRKVHDSVISYLNGAHNITDRGMKQSRHYVIRHLGKAKIDAVLVEGLFLSNRREADIIRNPRVQKEVGYSIAEGIARHLELPERSMPVEPEFPTYPIPRIARTVGVKVDGVIVDMIGLLAEHNGNFRTYLPMLDVGELADVEVIGKGDHIEINTGKGR